MRRGPLATTLLLVGIGLLWLSGLAVVLTGHLVDHDSAVTYLIASGHHDEFASGTNAASGSRWTTASQWQALWHADEGFAPGEVQSNVVNHSLHPPLYFWLTHVSLLASGQDEASQQTAMTGDTAELKVVTSPMHASVVLNLLIGTATLVLVYRLGLRVLRDARWAAVAAILLAISPVMLEVVLPARPYVLLALVTVGVVLATLSYTHPARGGRWLAAAAIGACAWVGMLSHYHFALVMMAIVMVLIADAWRRGWGRLARPTLCIGLAAVAFLATHPRFFQGFVQQRTHLGTMPEADPVARLGTFLFALAQGATMKTSEQTWLMVVLLLAMPALAWLGWRYRRRLRHALGATRDLRVVWFVLLACTAALGALYVTGNTHGHAVGGRYFAPLWPLMALVLLGLIRAIPGRLVLVGLLMLMLLVTGAETVLLRLEQARSWRTFVHAVAKSPNVVTDVRTRGNLTRLAWYLPGETPIYVAIDQSLDATAGDWLDAVKPGTLCVLSMSAPEAQRQATLKQLATRGQVKIVGRLPESDCIYLRVE